MIREFHNTDKAGIIQILEQGYENILQDEIEFILHNKTIVYVVNSAEIAGFCGCGRWGTKLENGKILTYVAPKYRRMGIGTLLYDTMMDYIKSLNLDLIETIYRVDKDDATAYYTKRGYKKWYGQHVMYYNGGTQPESNMQIVPYQDCYFEQYVDSMCASFYEMRLKNDFRPYNCVQKTDKFRSEMISDKNNIYIMLIDGRMAASAAVHQELTDVLGPVFVDPQFQGKGYGKIITQFVINEALRRGIKDITLEVVEWNKRAVELYNSLDFKIIQTINSCKLKL